MISSPAVSTSKLQQVHLIRHGETAWSLSGRHTGRTDIPLTARGEADACRLAGRFEGASFSKVFTSPLQRARRTAELAMPDKTSEIALDLAEWDYGDYEGLRSSEIRENWPDWNIFRDGCPGGELCALIA